MSALACCAACHYTVCTVYKECTKVARSVIPMGTVGAAALVQCRFNVDRACQLARVRERPDLPACAMLLAMARTH